MILSGGLRFPGDIAMNRMWFSRKRLPAAAWILVYLDPEGKAYKHLTGLDHRNNGKAILRPTAKEMIEGFCIEPRFFEQPVHADGYTAIEVNPMIFKCPGTTALMELFQQYNPMFLNGF